MPARKKSKTPPNEEDEAFEMVVENDTPSRTRSKRKENSTSIEIVDSDDGQTSSKKVTSKSPAKKSNLALDVNEDDEVVDVDVDAEEDDEEEGGEEEYGIEKILKHRTADDGTTEYLIHWEGYASDYDTWEPESHCNAPDLIAKYWKMQPTSKQPRKKEEVKKKMEEVKSPKKRGAKSSVDTSDDSEGELEDEIDLASVGNGNGSKKKKRKSSKIEVEEEDDGTKHKEELAKTIRLLEKWNKVDVWENDVESVETITQEDDGVLRAHLILKNGDELWVELGQSYKKCPQSMLRFYQDHLKFTPKDRLEGN